MKEWTKSTTQEAKEQKWGKRSISHVNIEQLFQLEKETQLGTHPTGISSVKSSLKKEGASYNNVLTKMKGGSVSRALGRHKGSSFSHYLVQIPVWEKDIVGAEIPAKEVGHVGWFLLSNPSWAEFLLLPAAGLCCGIYTNAYVSLSAGPLVLWVHF